ncbi:metallophosphoesterase [Bosea robiniae]|uniref:metallophosphoesterase n=1 Tax=Bosea robiniae TaxID=1036780 RepID=UPI003CC7AA8F
MRCGANTDAVRRRDRERSHRLLQRASRDGRRARRLGLRNGWVCMLLTYAIGDVHGRSDLLQTAITFCEKDAARMGGTPRIIFLDDLVDRGRDAKGGLEIVGRALTDHPASVFLRGNHDDWFLRFLENDRRQLRTWFHDGGRETIDSYCDLNIDCTSVHPEPASRPFRPSSRLHIHD